MGSKPDLNDTLKDAGRGATASAGRLRLRSGLVVAQVALTLVLLTGAGLMVNTMRNLAAVDPGFDTEEILTLRLQLDEGRYTEDAAVAGETKTVSPRVDAFHARVLRRLQTLPGVEAAAGIHFLPLSGWTISRILAIEGDPAPAAAEEIDVFDPDQEWVRPAYRAVLGDYFDVMRIPLLQGRAFTVRDTVEAPWVVVINRTMAEKYWPGENPIGEQLTVARDAWGGPAPGERPRAVVGVVEDVLDRSVQQTEAGPTMYVPAVQRPLVLLHPRRWRTQMSYLVRTAGDPMSLAPTVERVVADLDPDQPIHAMQPMRQLVAIWTDGPRFYTLLTVVFATVALVLSVIGIYGVMAYTVPQRTHEIGIRMSLGAARGHVVRQVALRGLALGASGGALGLVGAYWLTRLMPALRIDSASLLFGVSVRDPATWAAVSLLLVGAVLLACYGPTRVATKIDPMTALRHE